MPVLPSVRAARTGRISLSFIGWAFMEICRESLCAVAAGHKYRALYVRTDISSSVAGDTKPS